MNDFHTERLAVELAKRGHNVTAHDLYAMSRDPHFPEPTNSMMGMSFRKFSVDQVENYLRARNAGTLHSLPVPCPEVIQPLPDISRARSSVTGLLNVGQLLRAYGWTADTRQLRDRINAPYLARLDERGRYVKGHLWIDDAQAAHLWIQLCQARRAARKMPPAHVPGPLQMMASGAKLEPSRVKAAPAPKPAPTPVQKPLVVAAAPAPSATTIDDLLREMRDRATSLAMFEQAPIADQLGGQMRKLMAQQGLILRELRMQRRTIEALAEELGVKIERPAEESTTTNPATPN